MATFKTLRGTATLLVALHLLFTITCLCLEAEASDQQIVYIRNTCECWNTDLKCVCKIESDPTSVRPLMQRLVNRTAEYYWQDIEFQSMVYDRTTFILANTFADGPFPSGITFKGDFSIVNDSFNHLNMTLNKVELNFETFSGRKPKFSKQYWRYIFDHGEATLRTLRIIKYQIEDFIIPNYLGAALTQESRPLTEFKVTGCEVKEVKERAFKNFTQLEVLDLSDNHLTTLPENVFSRNINLQKILLANNQISFLTKTIFDGLPNLLLINLRKNKLTAVPAIPRHTNRRFQPMVYLMADNSIHCRCSLIWVLHELTFHHNLEIEATCSDPTMVRGMPIIEGFTRMDKEACYRVLNARKEDGVAGDSSPKVGAELAGPSDGPSAVASSPSVQQAQTDQVQAKSDPSAKETPLVASQEAQQQQQQASLGALITGAAAAVSAAGSVPGAISGSGAAEAPPAAPSASPSAEPKAQAVQQEARQTVVDVAAQTVVNPAAATERASPSSMTSVVAAENSAGGGPNGPQVQSAEAQQAAQQVSAVSGVQSAAPLPASPTQTAVAAAPEPSSQQQSAAAVASSGAQSSSSSSA